MSNFEEVDVLIIGSGPAGMSTALHLAQADTTWANRVWVVDKAVHPREKLCGGGIMPSGEIILNQLGLSFEPAHICVNEARMVTHHHTYLIQGNPVFRVVRRDEFDHWLVQQGRQRGVTIRQGEAVRDVRPHQHHVEVVTEQATIHAQVVVAADGSNSVVRRRLKWNDGQRLARLLEILTPESPDQQAFAQGVAEFDFRPMHKGLQGYYWSFPSLVNGRPMMNRGVFDSRAHPQRPRAPLKQRLADALAQRGHDVNDYALKGHPIHWFSQKARFSIPRIILAGDAAGVDPLFGEGISFALAYGQVAAAAVTAAFARQDFSFTGYRQRVLTHPFLSHLTLRTRLARFFYRFERPWQMRLLRMVADPLIYGARWYAATNHREKAFRVERRKT